MIDFIEYLGIPGTIAIVIIAFFFILQVVGEILEFKGKVVPEFIKVRKYFQRRKREREALTEALQTMSDVKKTLETINGHYSADNIRMRDNWMKGVNEKLECHDEWVQKFTQMLNKNNQDTLELLLESMRSAIIGFASVVADPNAPATREQFNRIFKIHKRYENLIKENDLVNGEVTIAYRIILESYEQHMRNHTFIENMRGYEIVE